MKKMYKNDKILLQNVFSIFSFPLLFPKICQPNHQRKYCHYKTKYIKYLQLKSNRQNRKLRVLNNKSGHYLYILKYILHNTLAPLAYLSLREEPKYSFEETFWLQFINNLSTLKVKTQVFVLRKCRNKDIGL